MVFACPHGGKSEPIPRLSGVGVKTPNSLVGGLKGESSRSSPSCWSCLFAAALGFCILARIASCSSVESALKLASSRPRLSNSRSKSRTTLSMPYQPAL